MVTLTHPIIGDKEFEKDHAEKLMNMKINGVLNNGGWTKKTKANAKLSGDKKDTGKTSKQEPAK